MLRRDYFGSTRSITWLLMPWLLTSPGHQQPWYWLCKMGRSFSSKRKNFNYLLHLIVEKWSKKQTYGFIIIDWFISSSIENLSKERVRAIPPFYFRDHFVYAPSQWETTLQCNVVSHWLGAHTKWSFYLLHAAMFWKRLDPVFMTPNAPFAVLQNLIMLMARHGPTTAMI